ncbi:vomeronasal type-2 receptor 26-like [Hyperolius riggenbachi]|uniref:vomeronasal type-2 receptor 26-like n=1 Tax=Hyperolius riggenbachi TaxID=752182 RepID=UPI0035A38AB3
MGILPFRLFIIQFQTPSSLCSIPCSPGYRKCLQKSKLPCCFDCVSCNEGEITNGSGMENCESCPDNQWPNHSRDLCNQRPLHFLSYEDPLGIILAFAATALSAITASVLWLYVKQRKTPLVRANNCNLSYVLLLSLLWGFLLSFLFIGHPEDLSCLMRQAAILIIFSVAISAVLGKSVTVIVAFNASKPRSRFKRFLGPKISILIVMLCSVSELVICLTWLSCSPPFVESDTKSMPGFIILQCNEGSVVAFYFAICYVGVLAVFSFITAFLSRQLPDTFNEAQHITFSMLVFCSVWISFIPTYLCSKGKHMVAVELFAILASNGALLGFIFVPKCHIILLKPELNSRGNIKKK